MVYEYRTVTCPHCGQIAEKTRKSTASLQNGSPFRVCPNCKKTYFDDYYTEKALVLFEDKGGYFNPIGILWLIIATIGAVSTIFFKYWLGAAIFVPLALLFGVGVIRAIVNRINPQRYHQKQIDYLEGRRGEQTDTVKASMQRLSNKTYLDALKAHGVSVPDYFYQRLNKDAANNNEPQKSVAVAEKKEAQPGRTVDEKQVETAFCRKCGSKMPADSAFCPKCGEKVITFHL